MRTRVLAVCQPVYLPWLGYFEQMAVADHFVFLDDVQYTRQDWRNRNRIKTADGPIWLTAPIRRRPLNTAICEIETNDEQPWRRRQLASIRQSYAKCAHFQPFFSDLAAELARGPANLADLDCRLTGLLCRYLGVETPTSRSSQIPGRGASRAAASGDKNQRLIDMCRHFDAELLYEGAKGRNYIDRKRFRRAGIEVVFQDYQHPVYPQRYGDFLSHLSAIDLIMNTGPEASAILRLSPVPSVLQRNCGASTTPITVAPGAR